MKLTVTTFVTLDRVMQSPGGISEDQSNGFTLVLGEGKRLFGDETVPTTMKLVDTEATSTGVIVATFESAGPLVQESLELPGTGAVAG